jgi:hypothetical protein
VSEERLPTAAGWEFWPAGVGLMTPFPGYCCRRRKGEGLVMAVTKQHAMTRWEWLLATRGIIPTASRAITHSPNPSPSNNEAGTHTPTATHLWSLSFRLVSLTFPVCTACVSSRWWLLRFPTPSNLQGRGVLGSRNKVIVHARPPSARAERERTLSDIREALRGAQNGSDGSTPESNRPFVVVVGALFACTRRRMRTWLLRLTASSC